MSKMFYDCQKLKLINLSTFDTSSVKYMDQLFYNCSSLEILDIKNFDLINLESFDDIFTKMNNILYIDLMNIKNEKNIWESLDKNEKFYICQSKVIIQNPLAFNCCEFMTNPNECNYIPPDTIMISQTTEISTFLNPINVDIIMVLFSWWKQVGNNCSFYIHFTSRTPNYIYPTKLKIATIFDYNRVLRRLVEKKGNCTLKENGIDSNRIYLCEIQSDNTNFKNVKMLPNLEFDSLDNISLHMTPLAKMYLNNIQDVKDKFNYLSNAQIYILDHCIINRYQKELLNISGEIHDPQPIVKNKDIILMINQDSESNTQAEINCKFTNIKLKNYSLNCRINEGMKGDFQNAISFIDDNILITYFDSYNESINEGVQTKENFNKRNGGSAGMIVAIIVVIIVCIGAVIATFIILKKKNVKQHIRDKSTNNAFI